VPTFPNNWAPITFKFSRCQQLENMTYKDPNFYAKVEIDNIQIWNNELENNPVY
jgi:hypothetical protein